MKFKLVLTLFFLSFVGFASAQGLTSQRICFTDVFGYVWKFDNITDNGDWTYYATGMIENIDWPSNQAIMWLDFRNGETNGMVHATAINNSPDNCTYYTDSFHYTGSAVLIRGEGIPTSYSGAGTWESFCYGGVISAGDWSASGPCARGVASPKVKTGILPSMGKQMIENLKGSVSVAPNPIKNHANIQYKVPASGKVNITVYNVMQQPVKVLVNENKAAGNYSISWNALSAGGARVPSGLYRVVATVGNNVFSTPIQVE